MPKFADKHSNWAHIFSLRLEFDGLYLAEQPADDDIKALWDKLVISARSFPVNYWDKFVKKRVREKYRDE